MTIHEPATLITDLLLGALAGWLAWRLRRRSPTTHSAAIWWSRALALTAVSALVGGTYHGFAPEFSSNVQSVWWQITLLSVCCTSAAMALSLLAEAVPPGQPHRWHGVIAFKFAAFAGAATAHPHFIVVIIDYGLIMLVWTVAAIVLARRWRGWLLTGVALSALAAIVQQLHWGLSAKFNHNDVYHVIQAFALLSLYRAGREFSGPPA